MGSNGALERMENVVLPLIQCEGGDVGHEFSTNCLLAFLKFCSRVMLLGVRLRMWLYKVGLRRRGTLGCRIIRVGNVTAGGTGKTPMVEALARELRDRGRKVAILSRGYRAEKMPRGQRMRSSFEQHSGTPVRIVSKGEGVLLKSEWSGDEPYMLACNLDGVAVLVDKDRVVSGRYAVKRLGCDTLLLDDGFQYMKLQGGIDMVLVDCLNPFGNGNVIPRGILREPKTALRRAHYICITKAKGRDTAALREEITRINPKALIMECDHAPKLLRNAFDRHEERPLSALQGANVMAVSGIASPASFENSLSELGAHLVGKRYFADHHRYADDEMHEMQDEATRLQADMIVTTEKDAVRMPLDHAPRIPVYFLRIEMSILKGQNVFTRCLQEITYQS
ncbi:MAG: tetraacyldisaccharide 4'-kinase [Kiritimatiellaeota bacterium]|nr:tetraacyldisaccharide 4'-kinase [Kiritimatiellota bacterium]